MARKNDADVVKLWKQKKFNSQDVGKRHGGIGGMVLKCI